MPDLIRNKWAASSRYQLAFGTILSADITGTTAGQFGHANGVPLVVIPTSQVVELIDLTLVYQFGVAAYTAGGNITVNATAGAAITGLVSAANSVGNAASRVYKFDPLAVAALLLVPGTGLSLVSSAAFTQPGTATGIIRWVLNYRTTNTNF